MFITLSVLYLTLIVRLGAAEVGRWPDRGRPCRPAGGGAGWTLG
jgi:hypothetical protein